MDNTSKILILTGSLSMNILMVYFWIMSYLNGGWIIWVDLYHEGIPEIIIFSTITIGIAWILKEELSKDFVPFQCLVNWVWKSRRNQG